MENDNVRKEELLSEREVELYSGFNKQLHNVLKDLCVELGFEYEKLNARNYFEHAANYLSMLVKDTYNGDTLKALDDIVWRQSEDGVLFWETLAWGSRQELQEQYDLGGAI